MCASNEKPENIKLKGVEEEKEEEREKKDIVEEGVLESVFIKWFQRNMSKIEN